MFPGHQVLGVFREGIRVSDLPYGGEGFHDFDLEELVFTDFLGVCPVGGDTAPPGACWLGSHPCADVGEGGSDFGEAGAVQEQVFEGAWVILKAVAAGEGARFEEGVLAISVVVSHRPRDDDP